MTRLLTTRHNRKTASSRFIPLVIAACVLGLVLQYKWTQQNRETLVSSNTATMVNRTVRDSQTTVLCYHCEGSGVIQDGRTQIFCPVCFGLGFRDVVKLSQSHYLCPRCSGMGRVPGEEPADAHTCTLCEGAGMIALSDPADRVAGPMQTKLIEASASEKLIVTDPQTGQRSVSPLTFGKQYREVRVQYEDDTVCPACGGLGRVRDETTGAVRTCRRCEGRGLIRTGESALDSADGLPQDTGPDSRTP